MRTRDELSVLLVGESGVSGSTHLWGFNSFATTYYWEADFASILQGSARLTHLPGHLAATRFPFALEELQDYSVILLSDVGADTFLLHPDTFLRSKVVPNRLRLIQHYVKQGGGFAMIGGYTSFGGFDGKGHYHGTPIEEILPVEIAPYDDRVEAPEGIRPVAIKPDHPILAGVEGPWPVFLGYNRLKPKPNAETVLEHDGHPMLALGSYERGRTAAFASDLWPHWATSEFTNWPHYRRFCRQLVAWLAGIEDLDRGKPTST